jgi:predicted HTH domain antitoxin
MIYCTSKEKEMMNKFEFKYPVGFEMVVNLTPFELEQHLRLMAALKMFELGKISSGRAAELAGLSRTDFFETCSRYQISIFNYADDEIAAELNADLAAIQKVMQ